MQITLQTLNNPINKVELTDDLIEIYEANK